MPLNRWLNSCKTIFSCSALCKRSLISSRYANNSSFFLSTSFISYHIFSSNYSFNLAISASFRASISLSYDSNSLLMARKCMFSFCWSFMTASCSSNFSFAWLTNSRSKIDCLLLTLLLWPEKSSFLALGKKRIASYDDTSLYWTMFLPGVPKVS